MFRARTIVNLTFLLFLSCGAARGAGPSGVDGVVDPRPAGPAELAPLARVGGLAEAASGLVRQLRADGVDVDIVLPDYGDIELADETIADLPVPEWAAPGRVRRGTHATVGPVALVSTAGVRKPHPYVDADGSGWADNDLRFFGFGAAFEFGRATSLSSSSVTGSPSISSSSSSSSKSSEGASAATDDLS